MSNDENIPNLSAWSWRENKKLIFLVLCIIFIGYYFYSKVTPVRLRPKESDPIESYSYVYVNEDGKEETRTREKRYKRKRYYFHGKPYTGKVYRSLFSQEVCGYLKDGYREGVWKDWYKGRKTNHFKYENGYKEGSSLDSSSYKRTSIIPQDVEFGYYYIKGEIQDGTYTGRYSEKTYENGKLVLSSGRARSRSNYRSKKSSSSIDERKLFSIIKGCCSGSGGTFSPSGQDCVVSNRSAFISCVGSGKVRYSNGNEYSYSGSQFVR